MNCLLQYIDDQMEDMSKHTQEGISNQDKTVYNSVDGFIYMRYHIQ